MPNLRLADGRPNVAAPPPRAAVRAGPTSSFHELRELAERHARGDDIRWRVPPRRAVQRRAWRPPVAYSRPPSSPRPREGGARRVVPSGRDGNGERDDGSGSSDGDGPPSPPSPPPAHDVVGGAR